MKNYTAVWKWSESMWSITEDVDNGCIQCMQHEWCV